MPIAPRLGAARWPEPRGRGTLDALPAPGGILTRIRLALPAAALATALIAFVGSSHAASRPDTSRVRLQVGNGTADAFVATPAGDQSAPAVVVVHEWWGLNGQIRDVARRLSGQGYLAIVPDLYGGRVAGDAETAHVLSRSLDEDAALLTLASAVQWLRAQPRTAKSKIAVMGFCMGGGLAERLAVSSDALSAAVVFYGTPYTDDVSKLRVPLQGHFGANDDGIAVDRVQAFRDAFVLEKRPGEVYVYGGAGHAFMNDERPSYRPDAAKLAWARTLSFLQKNLKK